MSSLLIVEDDPMLGRALTVNLELEGYHPMWVRDLRSGLEASQSAKFDLLLLDVNLPDGSGLDLCKTVRQSGSQVPVIFLTAKVDEDSVIAGFNAGANDYVRKPFGIKELVARVRATLKEPLQRDSQIRFGDLLLMIDKRETYYGDLRIDLNRREFEILTTLVQNAESVVTRDSLVSGIDREGDSFDRTVDSHVSHIRSKFRKASIDAIHITPIYGVGYRLQKKYS
jgi:two-component system, OmpR family, response regulator